MRGLLRRLGVRGTALLAIILLMIVVVVFAKLSGGARKTPQYTPVGPVTSTIDPTSGDDSEVLNPSAFPDDTAIAAAADAFAKAWLKQGLPSTTWLAGLTPLTTEAMAKKLEGVDPTGVPATRVVVGATIIRRTALYARTTTTLDTGTLILELSRHGERWLVESIDWERL